MKNPAVMANAPLPSRLDMAVWDAVAKIAGVPLYRLLADRLSRRHRRLQSLRLRCGGYYYLRQGLIRASKEMLGYLASLLRR